MRVFYYSSLSLSLSRRQYHAGNMAFAGSGPGLLLSNEGSRLAETLESSLLNISFSQRRPCHFSDPFHPEHIPHPFSSLSQQHVSVHLESEELSPIIHPYGSLV